MAQVPAVNCSMPEHGKRSTYIYHGCRCSECRFAQAEYQRNNIDPAKTKAYNRARYLKKKAEIDERNRQYRAANLEKERERSARYYQSHAEKASEKARAYRATPVGKAVIRATGFRRRGTKLTPEGREWMDVISGDPCSYCGGEGGTVDHIKPIKAGGDADWLNLAAACHRCNSTKSAQPLLMFMLRQAQRADALSSL